MASWVTISKIERDTLTSATHGGEVRIYCHAGSYIYMCENYPDPDYTRYWRKETTSGTLTSSSSVFTTEMGTNPDFPEEYMSFNVLATDTDLGPGPIRPADHIGYPDSYVKYLTMPKWAASFLYDDATFPFEFNNYDHKNLATAMAISGMTWKGLASVYRGYNVVYSSQTWSAALDGETWYGVYTQGGDNDTYAVYFYRGTSSRQTTYATEWEPLYTVNCNNEKRLDEAGDFAVESKPTTCLANSNAQLLGWATSSNSTVVRYSNQTDAYEAGYNTIYGVYEIPATQDTETVYYYRGSSTRYNATKYTEITAKKYYGMGSTSGGQIGDTTYSSITTSCAVSGWNYLGFSSNSNTTSSYSTPQSLFDQGYTTIYGTYNQTQSMTYYPQNGSSTGQVNVNNYRYGTGSTTNNRPSPPSLSYDNHTFQGWSKTSTGAVEEWNSLWDQGYRSVYAIWLEDYIYNVYYGRNNTWEKCKVYYGRNGNWEESQAYTGKNGSWQQ